VHPQQSSHNLQPSSVPRHPDFRLASDQSHARSPSTCHRACQTSASVWWHPLGRQAGIKNGVRQACDHTASSANFGSRAHPSLIKCSPPAPTRVTVA